MWSLDRTYFGGGIWRKALFICLAVAALSAFTISFSSISHYQTPIFPILASWYFIHIYIYIYIYRFLLTLQYLIKTLINNHNAEIGNLDQLKQTRAATAPKQSRVPWAEIVIVKALHTKQKLPQQTQEKL